MEHKHDIFDDDLSFVIDVDTKTIVVEGDIPAIMQYDHNSERLTFEIPSDIENHKMAETDKVEIHFINIGANGKRTNGLYPVDDVTLDADEEIVRFSWLISQEATQYAGSLSFAIRFVCGTDLSHPEYIWNTAPYSGISVGAGIDNTGAIATQYADVLQAWYNELIGAGDSSLAKIQKAAEDALTEVENAANNAAAAAMQTVSNKVETETIPAAEADIEAEKMAAISTIKVQADEIVNLVLSRLPRAEEASF